MNWYKRFTCLCMNCRPQDFRWWASVVNLVDTAVAVPVIAALAVIGLVGIIPIIIIIGIIIGIAFVIDEINGVMLKIIRRGIKYGEPEKEQNR